jgi:hypothetical protein
LTRLIVTWTPQFFHVPILPFKVPILILFLNVQFLKILEDNIFENII